MFQDIPDIFGKSFYFSTFGVNEKRKSHKVDFIYAIFNPCLVWNNIDLCRLIVQYRKPSFEQYNLEFLKKEAILLEKNDFNFYVT